MKNIIDKYRLLNEMLDDAPGVDDVTKDDLRKCLAIYINAEILIAFNQYAGQQKTITADMIAFFYLHLQMSGAANEALNRGFTDSNLELQVALFDDTADGKGAARLSRFAGAHATSLSTLINDFTPALLRKYMQELEEIKLVLGRCILSHVATLSDALLSPVEIGFTPMPVVDASSPQLRVNTQNAKASCLLESVKAIDILAPILSEERQEEFNKSHTAQALAIMGRLIFANNIFSLHGHDPVFAELRQFRNRSAHGLVMWEIQNNPLKLRFNCIRLVLKMRGTLLAQLEAISPDTHESCTNPPIVEIHVRDESCSSQTSASQAKVRKKKKPAESKEPHVSKEANIEFLKKRAEQSYDIKLLIIKLLNNRKVATDEIMTLKLVIGALEVIHLPFPELHIGGINGAVIATRVKGSKIVEVDDNLIKCQMQAVIGAKGFWDPKYTEDSTFWMGVMKSKYPFGIDKAPFYLIGEILQVFAGARAMRLQEEVYLNLLKRTLKMAFDFGASPNVMISTFYGELDVLSFAIYSNFPKDIIELFLDHGANVNIRVLNRSYISPLNHAARSRPDIVPLLLEAGANPTVMVYDPHQVPLLKSSLIFDVVSMQDVKIDLRLSSLRILIPYMYQKYGEQALLTNIDAPVTEYPKGGKIIVHKVETLYREAGMQTAKQRAALPPEKRDRFVQEDILPCILLRKKVREVLTNPKLTFYKLILNDEIGIMVQAIDRLALPKDILAAMGMTGDKTEMHSGKRFTAVEFALELGLLPLSMYLNRVWAYCYHMVCMAAIFNTSQFVRPMPAIIADYAMEPSDTFQGLLGEKQSIASRCL